MPEHSIKTEPSESGNATRAADHTVNDYNARNLLVSFRKRMVCTVADVFAILFVVAQLRDLLLNADWAMVASRPVLVGIVVLYFALAWASPLGATPVQYLWGIRVVGYDGQSLGLWRALLRSALVVGITAGAFTVFRVLQEPYLAVVAAGAIILFFVAAVTPYRQAAHDFLVRSLVVYRREWKQPEAAAMLQDVGGRDPSESRTVISLRFDDLLLDLATVAIPLVVLAVVLPVHRDKNMAARVSYALAETRAVQEAVQQFHLEHGRFPLDATALGVADRLDYPDGGYHQLEANGVVRIRFTVKPELKTGSLLLKPKTDNGKLVWSCSVDGTIDSAYLPSSCRG